MMHIPQEPEVVDALVAWGTVHPLIRAMILTSSRTRPDGPVERLERIAASALLPDQLDVGYRVLLDKDQRLIGWRPPSYQAHIPARPTEAEYQALVQEFWWVTTYVARSLWRDDLVFAKWVLDHDLKLEAMRRMLEWRIEIDQNWSVFARTYVSLDAEEIWAALDRVIALFRQVASDVGNALGYPYPQPVDDQVSAYLEAIRQMPSPPQ